MYIRIRHTKYLHKYICTEHELGWAMTSPNLFLESDTIYNIYMANKWDRMSHLTIFSLAHPAPPLHLVHMLGGSRLNCPWPTGT